MMALSGVILFVTKLTTGSGITIVTKKSKVNEMIIILLSQYKLPLP